MMKLNIKNWTNQNIKVVIFLVLFTLFGSCTKYKEKTLQDIGYWDVVFKNNKYETSLSMDLDLKRINIMNIIQIDIMNFIFPQLVWTVMIINYLRTYCCLMEL